MKSLTINDIARLAGVSHSTVSRVLNGHPDVNEKTKQRILSVIKENGYVPNNNARNLKLINTNVIGVVIKEFSNPMFARTLQIVEKKIYAHQYTMQLLQLKKGTDDFLSVMTSMKEKRWKGLLFLNSFYDHSPRELEHIRIPFVFLGHQPKQEGNLRLCASVAIDDRRSAFQAVNYLCELGHKNIAFIANQPRENPWVKERLEGYRQALHNHQPIAQDALIRYAEADAENNELGQGHLMTKELLAGSTTFTALLATSDMLAIGACRAIKDAGLSVPDDISVMGFGGSEQAGFYIPSLSTVKPPVEDMADTGVDTLLQMIEENTSARHFLFPTTIVKGESCAGLAAPQI